MFGPGGLASACRGEVVEALETGSIVVVDEAHEEGVAVGVRDEEPVGDAAFGLPTDGFDDPAIEAFDEAVGLRPVGSGETVLDAVRLAQTRSKGCRPDGRSRGLSFMSTAKRSVNSLPLSVRMV